MEFIQTLSKFIKENFYIIPLYIVLLIGILISHANVSIVESVSVFLALSIANVFFSYATVEYRNGNDSAGFTYSLIASIIYFATGLQGFIEYGVLHFMTIALCVYAPFYIVGFYKKSLTDRTYLTCIALYFAINILYMVLTKSLAFSSILSMAGLSLGAFMVVLNNKQVSWYGYSVILAQVLIILGSAISIFSNLSSGGAISGISMSYLLFPLVIVIPLIKEMRK